MKMNLSQARRSGRWGFLIALLLLLGICLLVACGGTGDGTSTDSDSTGTGMSTGADSSESADGSDIQPDSENPDDSNNADDSDSSGATDSSNSDGTGSDETGKDTSSDTDRGEDTTGIPVITLPADDDEESSETETEWETVTGGTETSGGSTGGEIEIETETETPPYNPEYHPGNSENYRGVMIASVYGTGKKGAEALISHGFVQLYNSSNAAISLEGASLYYKSDGANPFTQFVFPDGATIPAKGYYLVRANAPAGFVTDNAVMTLEHSDADWDIYIDNKEVRLLLAPSGWSITRDEDITLFDDAISCFVATMEYHHSVYSVYDLSRNKVAVRTAMADYSGYHLVNLTRTTTADLKKLCPRTSSGSTNTVVASRLLEVTFSHNAGIYEKAFSLTLGAPTGYTIYYTTDGSDPTTSSTRKVYSGPIALKDTSAVSWGPVTKAWGRNPSVSTQIGGHVIKAYARSGSEATPVYTNTYFVTDDLKPYGVTVMSISMPKNEIMGNGFYANYLSGGSITATRPRGVGILELFDANGNRVGNSRVEMAVSGNGSSGTGMKSLRIYYKGANNQDAGLQSDLNYDIFGGRALDSEGQAITSFSRILIRNSGNDCGYSYIRDAYMQRVCAGLNVDTMASATTLVFINGEFWGVYNIRERYSPEYVESHYGVSKENVTIIESDYSQVHTNQNAPYVVSSGEAGDADPFNEMVDYIRSHNMADAEAYAHIVSLMDVDSFIDMMVTRLYFNARDWPENNIKVWRNKNPDDPSGFDTKWHFTLLDMDMGFSYFPNRGNTGVNTTETDHIFWAFNENSVCGTMMCRLMNNADFRDQFYVRYYELTTEHFTVEYMSAELEAMIAERDPLMQLQQGRWSSDGASISEWNAHVAAMRRFVANRESYALRFFFERFGITEDQVQGISGRRLTVVYNDERADLVINGSAVANGTTLKFEKGQVLNLTIKVTAADGFVIKSITYTDQSGRTQTIEGGEGTFRVTNSGTITLQMQRENAEALAGGTLTAGATYMYYLTPNGDLYAWGDNRHGVLGLGYAGGVVATPTFVMSGVAKVATSSANAYENGDNTFATAILTTDGKVYTVGANSAGQLGRKGVSNDTKLGLINFNGKVTDISMGHDHLLILDESGKLWGIGSNAYGALGSSGAGGNVTSFQKIADNVATMSAGRRSTVYLGRDGRLWGVGDNRWKKLSQNHGDQILAPVVIASNMTFIDSGEHQVLAVDTSGKLFYAGWRTVQGFGQGNGNNPTFAAVMTGVQKADIYCDNMVILTTDGDAYVYGLNTDNGIGSAAVTNGTPKKILSEVIDVAAGYGFTAYLMEDGRILVQGNNAYGQAGNGTSTPNVNLTEVDF